jgi:hypothetical protein
VLELLRPVLTILNAFAVEYRYPGESADKEVARKAVKMAEEVKAAVVRELAEG